MNWTTENLNSKYLKQQLISHLFWRLHFPIVIDEYQFMDIFGIRGSGYMIEYEIKVSKSDLMREIRLMKGEQPIKYSKDWVKWKKHAHYLKRIIPKVPSMLDNIPGYSQNIDNTYFMPNEFYFYIPDFLVEIAITETVGTPYGVVKIGTTKNSYHREFGTTYYEVMKKAVKMHEKKADDKVFRSVAHGLTIRNRLIAT